MRYGMHAHGDACVDGQVYGALDADSEQRMSSRSNVLRRCVCRKELTRILSKWIRMPLQLNKHARNAAILLLPLTLQPRVGGVVLLWPGHVIRGGEKWLALCTLPKDSLLMGKFKQKILLFQWFLQHNRKSVPYLKKVLNLLCLTFFCVNISSLFLIFKCCECLIVNECSYATATCRPS